MRSWQDSATPGAVSEDQVVTCQREGGIRVGVVDGVTATALTEPRVGVSGGLWAAAVTCIALQAPGSLESCALAAHRELHVPGVAGRDQRQASLVAADCHGDEALLLRAGDCEAWVREGSTWRSVFTEPMLEPSVVAELLAWRRARPDAGHDEIADRERALLASESVWHSTPLGRFGRAKLEVSRLSRFDELVLTSDGARLNPARLDALEDWLHQDLRAWEEQYRPPPYRHGDIAVVSLARAAVDGSGGAGSRAAIARSS